MQCTIQGLPPKTKPPKLIKSTIGDSLNAKLIGTLYAGGVEKVGRERYLDRAFKLGQNLAA